MIAGLIVVKSFIDAAQERHLMNAIDEGAWSTELRRRVQHFGFRYDYRSRGVAHAQAAPPMPGWGVQLLRDIRARGVCKQAFDQMIVNEYLPGQGIAPHVDSPVFAEAIVSISLGSSCMIEFTETVGDRRHEILLEPRDLLLLSGEARYRWRHAIRRRRRDHWKGTIVERGRRLSITYRGVVQSMPAP